MIRALPAAAPVLGKHLAKNLDWPGADEIAEELEAMSQPQIPPELQQAIEEGKQKIAQLTEENQNLKLDQHAEQAKVESQTVLQKQKQDADIQLQREKAAAEIQLQREKAAAELQIKRECAESDFDLQINKADRDHEVQIMKGENAHEAQMTKVAGSAEAKDGKKPQREGPIMRGLNQLGQLVVQSQESTNAQLKQLAQIMAAPNELIRDPKTGKAAGSRKVLQ
jgi:hypothetical protein